MHGSGSSSSAAEESAAVAAVAMGLPIQGEGWGGAFRSFGGCHASLLLRWAGFMAVCSIMAGLAVVSALYCCQAYLAVRQLAGGQPAAAEPGAGLVAVPH